MLRFFLGFIIGLTFATTAEAAVIKGAVEGGKRIKKSPVVVYLAGATGEIQKSEFNPTLDQRNMAFIPHVPNGLKTIRSMVMTAGSGGFLLRFSSASIAFLARIGSGLTTKNRASRHDISIFLL